MQRTSTAGYRRLRAWQASMDLVERVYALTSQFPPDERYGLVAQLRRAAISVPSNLAEGNERLNVADKRRFVIMARASVAEIETQLELSRRLQLADSDQIMAIETQLDRIGRMLSRLRASLER